MKIIAHIYTPFKEKFGIPRQSGLAEAASRIVFVPEYRVMEAVRGIEEFSHLWLIWQFSENIRGTWSPTVRPPKLGGNKRMGVFATRSPFRPNPLGLSSVKLTGVDRKCENAPVLYVTGADMLDGTPIFDIKPYLSYTDCHTEAVCGFSRESPALRTVIPPDQLIKIPEEYRRDIYDILSQDPRPGYVSDPERIFYLKYAEYEISFRVGGDYLTVVDVSKD